MYLMYLGRGKLQSLTDPELILNGLGLNKNVHQISMVTFTEAKTSRLSVA